MPERTAAALQWQAARVLSVVCRPADGPDRGPPGRVRDSLGADTAMGGVRADALTILDGLITRIDRTDPYDHPHHDLAVLRQPSSQIRQNR